MESLPKIIEFDTWSTIVLNSFNGWKFSLLNPIYEFPRSILLNNFVDFVIEEFVFSSSNHFFENLPIFKTLRLSVFVKIPITIIVPPCFGAFHDVNIFGILEPNIVYIKGDLLHH